MSGIKTRRELVEDYKSRNSGESLMNGNGKVMASVESRTRAAPKENVFLFYPNLIGR